MAHRKRTIADIGIFKEKIHTALYKSSDIKELLLGDLSGKKPSEIRELFREHVKSHLFIDDTIEETGSFIFYDVALPVIHPEIKKCQVNLYAVVHRDILENYAKDGYYGNRADILAQMIEDCLFNDEDTSRDFGIGPISISAVYPYNSRRFYGVQIVLEVPNFR